MHEQTKGACVSVLVWAHRETNGAWPSYTTVYAWVQDFALAFDRHSMPYTLGYIAVYTPTPDGLTTAQYNHAYPDTADAPVSMTIPELSMIRHHVPLRISLRLLRQRDEQHYRSDRSPHDMDVPTGFRYTPHGQRIMNRTPDIDEGRFSAAAYPRLADHHDGSSTWHAPALRDQPQPMQLDQTASDQLVETRHHLERPSLVGRLGGRFSLDDKPPAGPPHTHTRKKRHPIHGNRVTCLWWTILATTGRYMTHYLSTTRRRLHQNHRRQCRLKTIYISC